MVLQLETRVTACPCHGCRAAVLSPGKLEDAVSCFIFRSCCCKKCKQFRVSRLLSFLGSLPRCGWCFGRAELPLVPAGKGEKLHQWLLLLEAG